MTGAVVVAAAIVRGGHVLAARRSAPPALAGGWEFPGGKVGVGETPRRALVRECREELGVAVIVGPRIGRTSIAPGSRLYLYAAALTVNVGEGASTEPTPLQDHDELRWVAAADLAELEWLPADRVLLPAVIALLQAAP